MQYKVIDSITPDGLQDLINENVKSGYTPVGGISVIAYEENGVKFVYSILMGKGYEVDEDKKIALTGIYPAPLKEPFEMFEFVLGEKYIDEKLNEPVLTGYVTVDGQRILKESTSKASIQMYLFNYVATMDLEQVSKYEYESPRYKESKKYLDPTSFPQNG